MLTLLCWLVGIPFLMIAVGVAWLWLIAWLLGLR